jgi:hypothetical protein
MNNLLRVKYLYDYDHGMQSVGDNTYKKVVTNRRPVACIVSDGENVGWSVCCDGSSSRSGDTFNKRLGRSIAVNRMLIGSHKNFPDRRSITNMFGEEVMLVDEFNFWVERMTAMQTA